MTASRVRLVLVIWLLALLVVIVATWQAIAVPRGALAADTAGGGTLVVASTLVVAALFQPVRRRIQRPIDRRFNRAGADAQRVVEAMSVTVRDEVDLERLRGSVVATASEAVHPAGAALWLRRSAG